MTTATASGGNRFAFCSSSSMYIWRNTTIIARSEFSSSSASADQQQKSTPTILRHDHPIIGTSPSSRRDDDDNNKHDDNHDKGMITTLTLNRPSAYNALSLQMLQELKQQLVECDRIYPKCRVVIIQSDSSQKAFSAGHDLSEIDRYIMEQSSEKGEASDNIQKLFTECHNLMTLIPKIRPIVIAKIAGIATAAGCQLVAACDLSLASATSRFAISGITIGLVCTTPIVQVSRTIPFRKRAFELLLTGDFITANDAFQLGLLNRVVDEPEQSLDVITMQLAKRIATHSSYATARGKEWFYQQLELPLYEASEQAISRITDDICHSEDAQTGIAAFVHKEKQPVVWKGR